jgi:hypothetical protein
VLAPGSVSRLVPVPGLAEHARGFKSLPEAIYLRNHVLEQRELADASDDAEERAVDPWWCEGTASGGSRFLTSGRGEVKAPGRNDPALRLAGAGSCIARLGHPKPVQRARINEVCGRDGESPRGRSRRHSMA